MPQSAAEDSDNWQAFCQASVGGFLFLGKKGGVFPILRIVELSPLRSWHGMTRSAMSAISSGLIAGACTGG